MSSLSSSEFLIQLIYYKSLLKVILIHKNLVLEVFLIFEAAEFVSDRNTVLGFFNFVVKNIFNKAINIIFSVVKLLLSIKV